MIMIDVGLYISVMRFAFPQTEKEIKALEGEEPEKESLRFDAFAVWMDAKELIKNLEVGSASFSEAKERVAVIQEIEKRIKLFEAIYVEGAWIEKNKARVKSGAQPKKLLGLITILVKYIIKNPEDVIRQPHSASAEVDRLLGKKALPLNVSNETLAKYLQGDFD